MIALSFDSLPIFPKLVDPLPDLVLRETLLGKIEKPFLALVEVEKSLRQHGFELADARLFVGHRIAHAVRDQAGEVVGEIEGVVVLDDMVLDHRDGKVRQVAEALLAVDAEVVLVLSAVAGGLGVDEFAASPRLLAAVAVEQLLQVVEVGAVPARRRGAFFENLLDDREQLRFHEPLVTSREQFTLVANETYVVRAGQHGVPLVERDVLGVRVSTGAAGCKPAVDHGLREPFEGVVPRGIQLKPLADERCAEFIKGHGTDHSTLEVFLDIEVAQRCTSDRAAELGLMSKLSGDVLTLGCRAVLVDRGEDAARHLPSR